LTYCTNCGAPNEPGTQYCTKCGAPMGALTPERPPEPVPPPPPVTPGQGQAWLPSQPVNIPPPGGYVPQPGYGPAPPYDPTAKSKLAAGLLGIFLGAFGVHRFYLGFNNIAIAQLAVGVIGLILLPFTCGLIFIGASIWGLIDGIMILTGSISADATGRPLRD
jgi:TM2 domain-containing membrane protein YozV